MTRGNPDHPVTQGFLCPKMRDIPGQAQDPDRLLYPLIRTGEKGEGQFRPASWEEALELVAGRLGEIVARDPASLLQFGSAGNMGLLNQHFPERFFGHLGATGVDETICNTAGQAALRYLFGSCHGADPEIIPQLDLLVTWGGNPAWSNIHGFSLIRQMMARGGRYLVIDPLFTSSARVGEHLALRPGTDYHLAMGLVHLLISQGAVEERWARENLVGWERLQAESRRYSPGLVEAVTGIEKRDLQDLASSLAQGRALIHMGWGFQRRRGGGAAVRAVGFIPALLGWGRRGFIYSNNDYGFDLDCLQARSGARPRPRVNQMKVGRLLAQGQFSALMCYGANPMASLADLGTLERGLSREDLFTVVHDLFLTDTARMADVVLPSTHFLESEDLCPSYFHRYLGYNAASVAVPGQAVSNRELFRLLAREMDLKEEALYDEDASLISGLLEGNPRLDTSLEELRTQGFAEIRPPDLDGLETPSGKVELLSGLAGEEGAGEFPLAPVPPDPGGLSLNLLSPAHRDVLRSQDHRASLHRAGELRLNPVRAEKLGIEEGSTVIAESPRGRAKFRVCLDPRVPPGVALSYSSPWASLAPGGTPNHLTSDEVDSHGGGSTYNSAIITLRPVNPRTQLPPPEDGEE